MDVLKLSLVFLSGFFLVCGYYAYAFADWSPPYHRIFGVANAVAPQECINPKTGRPLDPGPVPNAIHIGDCVRQEWTVNRTKVCNAVKSDPNVYRWLIDEKDDLARLPVIPSEQVNNEVPRMSKTFIQPQVSIRRDEAWVSYRAQVCLECPTNAFLVKGKINPFHRLIKPVCIKELSTEYRVEAKS